LNGILKLNPALCHTSIGVLQYSYLHLFVNGISEQSTFMAAPEPLPRYVYKIHVPGPSSLKELSELDRQSGFIHLSTAQQVSFSGSLSICHLQTIRFL
jgi:hypothetical protein